METSEWIRFSTRFLSMISFFAILSSFFIDVSAANELSLSVGQPTTVQVSSGMPVESSPGSKSGALMLCERVHIRGLSRLHDLRKYAHSVKVNVSIADRSPKVRIHKNVEVCFHRNMSLGLGMCPQGQWEKLIKGSWVRSMSPFDSKLLDTRMPGPSFEVLEVSIEEEFLLHRLIFLVLGIVMLTMAPTLSKSIVFYYSSAMAVGIILVILMVLFQGMKLLPTGRKSSLAIFMYSSFVGVGSFLLRYLPRLLHSVLVEIGISEDMYNPLVIFLLVCVVLAGAWLGFWVVHKLVLAEDGSVDLSIALFVAWSIRFFAAVMIIQSSLDPVLASEALVSGILISSLMRSITKSRFIHRMHKRLFRTPKSSHRRSQIQGLSPEDSYDEYLHRSEKPELLRRRAERFALYSCNSPVIDLAKTPASSPLDSDSYFSTFHNTPERKRFSKEEWEKFTKDSTKNALEELVSSPDFSKWAVTNAERITLAPANNNRSGSFEQRRRRWFHWF